MTFPDPTPKWRCNDCGHVASDFLRAPNPFDPSDELTGCTHCQSVNTLVGACQMDGCTQPATSGTPNAYGFRYIWTCWEHSPHNPANKAAAQ